MASLSDTLQQFKSSFDADTPPEILETLNRSISLFQNQGIIRDKLLIDDPFPAFELQDIEGKSYSSVQMLKHKPLIVTFVRGGWCPYCMLEMRAWQQCFEKHNHELNLVAITPELPHFANTMKLDNNLSFPLLFDYALSFITRLGLVWSIDEAMKAQLMKWNINLSERHRDDNFSLPVPATFVIDSQSRIKYRFVEEDYFVRAEPEEVLDVYYSLT